jgi:hypothetical protein
VLSANPWLDEPAANSELQLHLEQRVQQRRQFHRGPADQEVLDSRASACPPLLLEAITGLVDPPFQFR